MTTKTTQHTQGPWHTGDIGRKGLGWCTIFADTIPIARALSLHPKGQRQSADFGFEAANARLIASAPELLEACKIAEQNLSPAYCSAHIVLKMLRAAIAKAEGK